MTEQGSTPQAPGQPAGTLTEEERAQLEDARYHAEKYPSEWWSEAILELADIIDRLSRTAATPTDGWKLVPRTPTNKMVDASEGHVSHVNSWQAMYDAAPNSQKD